jgi:hypothetical protein
MNGNNKSGLMYQLEHLDIYHYKPITEDELVQWLKDVFDIAKTED